MSACPSHWLFPSIPTKSLPSDVQISLAKNSVVTVDVAEVVAVVPVNVAVDEILVVALVDWLVVAVVD
jgi:hypothetical protein